MGQVYEKMKADLNLRRYAARTQKSYLYYARRFCGISCARPLSSAAMTSARSSGRRRSSLNKVIQKAEYAQKCRHQAHGRVEVHVPSERPVRIGEPDRRKIGWPNSPDYRQHKRWKRADHEDHGVQGRESQEDAGMPTR